MPRILSYTPSWLARNTSGFQVFAETPKQAASSGVKSQAAAHTVSPLIARRGTQVFVAVGNEIRWTDLVYLKDYEAANSGSRKTTPSAADNAPESLYRVRLPPTHLRILTPQDSQGTHPWSHHAAQHVTIW
jgi:nucleoporin NUP82